MRAKGQPFNERAAEQVAVLLGSMNVFWIVMIVLAGWIGLQTILHGFDTYPFVFLLFLTNLIQFMSIFVLQNAQNRQTERLQAILGQVRQIVKRLESDEEELVAEEKELVDELRHGIAS